MSTMRRVYLPLHTDDLRTLSDSRSLSADSLDGFAVTDAVRAQSSGADDDEQHEYAAMQDAALCAIAEDAPVVGAVDVAESAVVDGDSDAKVTVRGPLLLKRFASFHLIDRAAAAADPDEEIELSWFDATELALVMEVLEVLDQQ